jgi:hypothetical protein
MYKHALLLTCSLALMTAGCASMPFGKKKEPTVTMTELEYNKLLEEKAILEQKIAAMVPKPQYDAVVKERADLEKQVAEMVPKPEHDALIQENAQLEKKLKASEDKVVFLEKEKEGEKVILLFDGKIKYSVEAAAGMDYEEVLVLTMLDDPEFKGAMDMGGKEADIALIGLLKKITFDDRRITSEEIKTYLKSKKK